MHLEGKGRNEIAESFKHQVSSGTVSNVLKQYREQPESFNKSDRVTTFTKEVLGEVEFKKNPDISIENHAIINTQRTVILLKMVKIKAKKVVRYPGLRRPGMVMAPK